MDTRREVKKTQRERVFALTEEVSELEQVLETVLQRYEELNQKPCTKEVRTKRLHHVLDLMGEIELLKEQLTLSEQKEG